MAKEKARNEAQLRAERDRLKAILSSIGEDVAVVGADCRVYFQNGSSLRKFGDLTGKLCYQEFMKRSQPCESCPREKALQTNTTQSAELLGADSRHYEVTATPFVDSDGERRAIEVVRDTTERKRAEEEIERHARRLEALYATVTAVSETLNLDRMLDGVLKKVLELTKFEGGGIYLVEGEELILRAIRGRGISEQAVKKVEKMQIGRGLPGQVAQSGRYIFVENIAEDTRLSQTVLRDEGMKSFAGVPLKSKNMVIGVLCLMSSTQRQVLADEVQLLEAIANEIAVGIESVRLLDKTIELALIDELTALYNRRHFYEVLETEMHRTQRYGRSFSLAMLDLDGFKAYNDRFGHTNGDAVLKAFAQTLRSALRKSDTAFRYGGDEFVIIMPATDADRAETVVSRIRSKWLEAHGAEHLVLESPLGLSAGIAEFPEDAETADGLVFLADTGLYRSKRQGGNKSTLVYELGTLTTEFLDVATLDQVHALSATVEAKDPYTYGHSKRVAAISEIIGRAIGLSREELANLQAASLLHDIGKVGLTDSILTKPGKPTEAEWELIRKHSAEGARIVGHVSELAAAVPMIRHHHEWYDGNGYPEGLRGEDIPVAARIIAIADAYDTMTTARTYRKIVSQEEALEELRRCSGTQFDPQLVEALCRAVSEAAGQE